MKIMYITPFRKRATPSGTFAIFLLALIGIQFSSFYNQNRKLLRRLRENKEYHGYPVVSSLERVAHPSVYDSTNNDDDGNNEAPNLNAILMIHYHKTGFVLSRNLRTHAIKHFSHFKSLGSMNNGLNYTLPLDKPWGSILQPRKFDSKTYCPEKFGLRNGVIDVQESPDFYCGVEEMARILLLRDGDEMVQQQQQRDTYNQDEKRKGTKIVHFVRNPYSMALSNYYYHSQVPTPEPWVSYHNPCQTQYYNDTITLRDVLFPTLSDESILTQEQFDKIVNLCNSLYQTKSNLTNAKFEGHLHQLDPIDGLRLSTAQMMIHGGGKVLVPGGDLLRMANNIIKLRQLEEYLDKESNFGGSPMTVTALSMDEFITNPLEFTTAYLNILVGDDAKLIVDKPRKGRAVIRSIAGRFARNYNETKAKESHKHVTTGKHEDRKELLESLKKDDVLGPVLDAIEVLVDAALR